MGGRYCRGTFSWRAPGVEEGAVSINFPLARVFQGGDGTLRGRDDVLATHLGRNLG